MNTIRKNHLGGISIMKKFTAYLLTSIVSLGLLSGCGTSANNDNSVSDAETPSSENSVQLTDVRVSEVVHSVFYAPSSVNQEQNYPHIS